jgi:hypothetical protein
MPTPEETAKREKAQLERQQGLSPVVATEIRQPADILMREALANIMMEMLMDGLSTNDGKKKLHHWFLHSLSDDERMYLYQEDRARKEALRVANLGASLQQEIPALMSSVKF